MLDVNVIPFNKKYFIGDITKRYLPLSRSK